MSRRFAFAGWMGGFAVASVLGALVTGCSGPDVVHFRVIYSSDVRSYVEACT